MEYFLLILLPCLSALKVFVQGKTAQGDLKNVKDCFLFTGLTALVSAIFLSAVFLRSAPTEQELLFALAYALFSTCFQFFYILAFRYGSVSIASTVTSFAIVLPILYGVIVYRQPVNVFQYVAFGLMAASFILVQKRTKEKTEGKKGLWLLFTLLAFLFSGLTSTAQVVVSMTEGCDGNVVVIFSYLFSAAICFICTAFVFGQKLTLRPKKSLFIGVPLIAISLGLYNLFSVFTLEKVPATIFYTVVPGTHLVLINLIGIFILKEKKTPVQYVGIALAVIAVILARL